MVSLYDKDDNIYSIYLIKQTCSSFFVCIILTCVYLLHTKYRSFSNPNIQWWLILFRFRLDLMSRGEKARKHIGLLRLVTIFSCWELVILNWNVSPLIPNIWSYTQCNCFQGGKEMLLIFSDWLPQCFELSTIHSQNAQLKTTVRIQNWISVAVGAVNIFICVWESFTFQSLKGFIK